MFLTNSKGQIFSLDLIIGFALTLLAVGLLFKHAEIMNYIQKDDTLQAELYRVGLAASNNLVGNPAYDCNLADASGLQGIDYLPNCIRPGLTLSKEMLGIPEGFNCRVTLDYDRSAGAFDFREGGAAGCGDSPPAGNVQNIFSIDRKVALLLKPPQSSISKQELEDCMNQAPGCLLAEGSVNLKVWKQ